MPNSYWESFSNIIGKKRNMKFQEQKKSFGSLNPNITFYVIRRRPPGWGFFSNVMHVLQGLVYAEENYYTPVVDMENYWLYENSEVQPINGSYNVWCYFFEQVSEFSLDEVYKSNNVILSSGDKILGDKHWFTDKSFGYIFDKNHLSRISEVFHKYVRLNDVTLTYVKSKKIEINWSPKDTLGVFVRGTNYNRVDSSAPPTPTIDFFSDNLNNLLSSSGSKRLFVSTEDFNYFNALNSTYGSILLPSLRLEEFENGEQWEKTQKLNFDGGIRPRFIDTLNYLTEIFLLSECSNFIGNRSNGSVISLIANAKHFEIARIIFPDGFVDL